MNRRERVIAALNHKQPDRVAVDFGGHRSSGISAMAYRRLKEALGISSGGIYVYDMVQQLAVIEPPVLDALDIDVIELGRAFHLRDDEWKEWTLPDGTACRIPKYIDVRHKGGEWFLFSPEGVELGVQKKSCLYFEQSTFPLLERGIENDDFADLASKIPLTIWAGVPHPGAHFALDEAGLKELTTRARTLRASTDRAIVGLFGGNVFELPQWLYRMDNYLMYMGLYPEQIVRLSEKLCELYLAHLEKWLGAVGPYIDVVLFGDDLGGQRGPLLSPGMYREYYQPYHRKLWRRTRELAKVKVQLHCCGGVRPLLSDLIDAGLDAINPVQISCDGMDAAGLKRDFGDRMVFWGGGCDTRDILPNATPAEIREHVRRQVDLLQPGGGFVFQQVHNIMANVPPENIIAMFRAVRE
jgi:uroporphyrinogen decarboxylase